MPEEHLPNNCQHEFGDDLDVQLLTRLQIGNGTRLSLHRAL